MESCCNGVGGAPQHHARPIPLVYVGRAQFLTTHTTHTCAHTHRCPPRPLPLLLSRLTAARPWLAQLVCRPPAWRQQRYKCDCNKSALSLVRGVGGGHCPACASQSHTGTHWGFRGTHTTHHITAPPTPCCCTHPAVAGIQRILHTADAAAVQTAASSQCQARHTPVNALLPCVPPPHLQLAHFLRECVQVSVRLTHGH